MIPREVGVGWEMPVKQRDANNRVPNVFMAVNYYLRFINKYLGRGIFIYPSQGRQFLPLPSKVKFDIAFPWVMNITVVIFKRRFISVMSILKLVLSTFFEVDTRKMFLPIILVVIMTLQTLFQKRTKTSANKSLTQG